MSHPFRRKPESRPTLKAGFPGFRVKHGMGTYPSRRLLLAILLVLGLVFVYSGTFRWLFTEWSKNGIFTWETGTQPPGFLVAVVVVIIIGYATLRNSAELSAGKGSLWWVLLIAGGLGLKLAGDFLEQPSLSAVSLIPAALGVVALFSGIMGVRLLLVPGLLFLLAVPFPVDEWGVTGFLAQIVATVSAPLGGLGGAPVFREGQLITVGGYRYIVTILCSGFSSIMVLLVLVMPFRYLTGASLKSLGLSLIWLPALGMATKIGLVSMTLALTPRLGQETALKIYHGWLGVLFFLLGLGIALLPLTFRRK